MDIEPKRFCCGKSWFLPLCLRCMSVAYLFYTVYFMSIWMEKILKNMAVGVHHFQTNISETSLRKPEESYGKNSKYRTHKKKMPTKWGKNLSPSNLKKAKTLRLRSIQWCSHLQTGSVPSILIAVSQPELDSWAACCAARENPGRLAGKKCKMLKLSSKYMCSSVTFAINVNPGLINPKRLFNWGDTIKKYQMQLLFGGTYPP